MIFHFHTGDVTFFTEDQDYFEKRLSNVVKYLGNEAGDEDSTQITVHLSKNKHHSGEHFEAKAHMSAPHGGDFNASAQAENIQKLADIMEDELAVQIKKFHDKKQR